MSALRMVFMGTPRFPLFEWFNAATGWRKSPEAYMAIGRRIQTLKQAFNIKHGIDPMNVIRAGCATPVHHYKLDVGLLQEGDPADFIVVDNLEDFKVLKTYIDGKLVAEFVGLRDRRAIDQFIQQRRKLHRRADRLPQRGADGHPSPGDDLRQHRRQHRPAQRQQAGTAGRLC